MYVEIEWADTIRRNVQGWSQKRFQKRRKNILIFVEYIFSYFFHNIIGNISNEWK